MESSKEEEDGAALLDRTARPTRGKRMSKLLDDEAEEDEAFWNQDALKEEENDDEYEDEGDVADEFDSDFDEDVSEPDDAEKNEAEARAKDRPPKKRLMYTGKPPSKKRRKDLSKLEETLKDEIGKDVSISDDEKLSEQVSTPDPAEDTDEVDGEKTVRKSTRTAVIVRQAEREAIRAALQATARPIKRKKEGEEKRMTQEEMLLEAAQTEIMNLRNLERVLAREEEVKKRAIVQKAVYTGPLIRYISKDGQSFIEFSNGMSFKSELRTKKKSYPERAVCAVTGLPARYRDPKTGLPYATKEAFQILRKRYEAEHSNSKGKINAGILCDLITGQGFVGKKKRSVVAHQNEMSRDSRRFCRMSLTEILDSD